MPTIPPTAPLAGRVRVVDHLRVSLPVPRLGLDGARDPTIPLATIEPHRLALPRAAVAVELAISPEAAHAGFADDRPSDHAGAATDAGRRCLDWLQRHGVLP